MEISDRQRCGAPEQQRCGASRTAVVAVVEATAAWGFAEEESTRKMNSVSYFLLFFVYFFSPDTLSHLSLSLSFPSALFFPLQQISRKEKKPAPFLFPKNRKPLFLLLSFHFLTFFSSSSVCYFFRRTMKRKNKKTPPPFDSETSRSFL